MAPFPHFLGIPSHLCTPEQGTSHWWRYDVTHTARTRLTSTQEIFQMHVHIRRDLVDEAAKRTHWNLRHCDANEREGGGEETGCIRSVYMLCPVLRHYLTLHTCGLTEQAQQSCGHGNTSIRHAHRPLNPVPPRPLGASLRPIFAARFT